MQRLILILISSVQYGHNLTYINILTDLIHKLKDLKSELSECCAKLFSTNMLILSLFKKPIRPEFTHASQHFNGECKFVSNKHNYTCLLI